MPLLEVDALTRHYGSRRGIADVSFSVNEGSLFGFLGPNGAGKTTAIRVLLGLLRASGGRARAFGLDCWRDTARIKRDIGYVPGDLRLYPWMNGRRALAVFGKVRGRDLSKPGRDLADLFGLDLAVKVRSMSRGMRQKLGLILALAPSPRLLVLDEPSSGLDPLMQEALRRHLRSLAAAGHTVFFSSHTLGEVDDLCDQVVILREGRVVVNERLETLRARAGYLVTIKWKPTAPSSGSGAIPAGLEPPAALSLTQRSERTWSGIWQGDASGIVRWLDDKPIGDLSISRPDLETLFHQYYEGGAATPK